MTNKTLPITDVLHDYILSTSLREPILLQRLREETAGHPYANMQIAPEQGQFMSLLVELIRARKILEVGVFTGYSSTCMALALPADGIITACEINPDYASMACRYWNQLGVADKIDLRLGPALTTLDSLIEDGASASYDLVFIDADKSNYHAYYERTLQLLRPGGLLLVDNVLWSGKVAEADFEDEDTVAIRALNKKIHADHRVSLSLLPIADGLTLALKR